MNTRERERERGGECKARPFRETVPSDDEQFPEIQSNLARAVLATGDFSTLERKRGALGAPWYSRR